MTASHTAAEEPSVQVADDGPVRIVTIDRPERRNAVDLATSHALAAALSTG